MKSQKRKTCLSLFLVAVLSLCVVGYSYSSGVLPGSCRNPQACYTCHHTRMSIQNPCSTCHASITDMGCEKGAFAAAGTLTTGRFIGEAVHLEDNRVFVVGGANGFIFDVQDTAEIYDPETRLSTLVADTMSKKRWSFAAERLPDGRVLITGGRTGKTAADGVVLAACEIFDPVTETFSDTGSMNVPRRSHRGIALNDGRIFVAGGGNAVSTGTSFGLASAEIYDPATGTWTRTSQDMYYPRQYQTMTLLKDGRVFIMGGCKGPSFLNTLNTAEIYDPGSDTFSLAANMSVTRMGQPCVTLRDGRVLLTHSFNALALPAPPYVKLVLGNEAEIYDPATNSYTQIANTGMHKVLELPGIPLLDDTILIPCGGNDLQQAFPTAHIFDPQTQTFPRTGSLQFARDDLKWVRLKDGRPLVLGGLWQLYGTLKQIEVYTPSLETQVGGLMNSISDLPGTAFKNQNQKTALINLVASVKRNIALGNFQDAVDIMKGAVITRMDGCFGGLKKDDMVVTCDAQDMVYHVAKLLIATLEKTITGNAPPIASASADVTSGELPLTVQFTGTGTDTDGQVIEYNWDFDDGTSSKEQNPIHTFNCVGIFKVQLMVVDDYGAAGTSIVTVTVTDNGQVYTSYRCKVQPVFNAYCTVCHASVSPAANLDLSNYTTTMIGGVQGPCVIPYDPANSLLVEYVAGYRNHPQDQGFMNLGAKAINDIKAWIAEGANDN
jgi:hypothetical protein